MDIAIKNHLIILCLIGVCAGTGCSQTQIDSASYQAGEVAGKVATKAEEGYHTAVRASKSAYREIKKGFNDQYDQQSAKNSSEKEPETPKRTGQSRQGDEFY